MSRSERLHLSIPRRIGTAIAVVAGVSGAFFTSSLAAYAAPPDPADLIPYPALDTAGITAEYTRIGFPSAFPTASGVEANGWFGAYKIRDGVYIADIPSPVTGSGDAAKLVAADDWPSRFTHDDFVSRYWGIHNTFAQLAEGERSVAQNEPRTRDSTATFEFVKTSGTVSPHSRWQRRDPHLRKAKPAADVSIVIFPSDTDSRYRPLRESDSANGAGSAGLLEFDAKRSVGWWDAAQSRHRAAGAAETMAGLLVESAHGLAGARAMKTVQIPHSTTNPAGESTAKTYATTLEGVLVHGYPGDLRLVDRVAPHQRASSDRTSLYLDAAVNHLLTALTARNSQHRDGARQSAEFDAETARLAKLVAPRVKLAEANPSVARWGADQNAPWMRSTLFEVAIDSNGAIVRKAWRSDFHLGWTDLMNPAESRRMVEVAHPCG